MAKRSDESLYSLPETTQASRAARMRLDALLLEAKSLLGVAARLSTIKTEISALVQAEGLANDNGYGVRNGNVCAIVSYAAPRRTLNRALLVENGVSPDVIAASMKESEEGTWRVELQEIGGEA